jgi:hypothetical protein
VHGVRLAGPDRPVPAGPLRIQRRVSGRGVTKAAGQTLLVGFAHRHTLVDIDDHESAFHVYDPAGEPRQRPGLVVDRQVQRLSVSRRIRGR